MAIKLNTTNGSITLDAEDGSGNVDITVPRAGFIEAWILEDDDGTEVNIGEAKEVKFIGDGITTNWTDTDGGTDGDPYDLTFTVDAAQSNITSVGTLTSLTVDNVVIDGAIIGHTGDTDLITLASGVVTVAGEVSATTLDIGGTNISATATEINQIAGITDGTAAANKVLIPDSNVDLSGLRKLSVTSLQTLAAGQDIASATAVDLTAATGNVVVITGTITSTSLTMTKGQQMTLIAAAAWPLTHHATTMNITGGVDFTCAAGDRLHVVKDDDDVIRVSPLKQDGTSVVAPVSDATQTLTDGATVNWNHNSGNVGLWAIAGNRTLAAPTNPSVGSSVLRITQDGTGSRTVTWNSVFKWSAGSAPVLSTAANAIDVLSFIYDGTNHYGTLVSRGAA